MSNNHRPLTTVTKSISFDLDVFKQMEARRLTLRLDRSTFIRFVLEDRLGIVKRPMLIEGESGIEHS